MRLSPFRWRGEVFTPPSPEPEVVINPYDSDLDSPASNPFTNGSKLSLTVEHGFDIPIVLTTEVTVVKLIQPTTMSPVMEVMLQTKHGLETKAILKLYDRRFATGLRKLENVKPWTPTIEELYRQYVWNGKAEKLFEVLDEPSDDEESGNDDDEYWDEEECDPNLKTGQREGYLHHYCRKIWANEVRAYETLRDLQGDMIPKFLAPVCLSHPNTDIPHHLLKYFDIMGILIEYIDGFELFDIKTKAPQSQWQAICEDAIRTVNLVGDYEIINCDVRPGNFLVKKAESGETFQVFQIDFAQTSYRDGLSWEMWKDRKVLYDEEGAVGLVMQKELEGGFKYKPSYKYLPELQQE